VTTPASSYPIVFCVSVTGSDTTTCFDGALGAIGNSAALSVTVTGGTTGDLVLFIGGLDPANASTLMAGGGGTNSNSLYLNTTNSNENASLSYDSTGGASVTGTYNLVVGVTTWSMYGASFKIAGAGPPPAKGSTLTMMGVG
jgi:hypothetical protein